MSVSTLNLILLKWLRAEASKDRSSREVKLEAFRNVILKCEVDSEIEVLLFRSGGSSLFFPISIQAFTHKKSLRVIFLAQKLLVEISRCPRKWSMSREGQISLKLKTPSELSKTEMALRKQQSSNKRHENVVISSQEQ